MDVSKLALKLKSASKIWAKYLNVNEVEFIKHHALYNDNLTFAHNAYNICYNITETPRCDHCKNILKYRDFKSGYGQFCSRKCGNAYNTEKAKATNMKKYGASSWLQSVAGQSYSKKVNKEKYGCEIYQQSEDFKRKTRNTWHNKTDDELAELNIARVKHNNSKYGCDYFFQTKDYKDKARKTLISRYGVDNAMRSKDIKQKSIDAKQNSLITNIETSCSVKLIDRDQYMGVALYKKYKWECQECNTVFYHDLSIGHRPACSSCFPKTGTNLEVKIIEILDDLNIDYQVRNRQLIKPLEVDFFIESKNVAIEVNGLRWHGERSGGKYKLYHLHKHKLCKEKGIRLIQLYEDDICDENKFPIISSRLRNILGGSCCKLDARKCKIEKISGKDARHFLVNNHIQGYAPSSYNYGLIYDDEIVSIATFLPVKQRVFINNNRNCEDDCLELVRFSSKINTNVRGALSRLISHCQKENHTSILTYSDLDWGCNTSYKQVGFKSLGETGPGFWYVRNNRRYNRFRFTKKTVMQHIDEYDNTLSVYQNCINSGILTDRIWGCGNEVFRLDINK